VKIVHRQSFDHERPFEREFRGHPQIRADLAPARQPGGHSPRRSRRGLLLLRDGTRRRPVHWRPDQSRPLRARSLKSDLQFHSRLSFEKCVRIGIALTTALEHLHTNGLVHRDVKPSNIIFVNGVPKLADIGLVTGADATRSYVGTEGFAAPEGPGTAQADIYSLGKVLYEAATGKDRRNSPTCQPSCANCPTARG